MEITPAEVTAAAAFAGILFTVGGYLWGHGKGQGKQLRDLGDLAEKVSSCKSALTIMDNNFKGCQLASSSIGATSKTRLEEFKQQLARQEDELKKLDATITEHHMNRDIHTDYEWRHTIIGRFDSLEKALETRIETFQGAIMHRIETLEKTIKNGKL
jgi:uncharacterized coiled-coil protein SlyX